MTTPFFYFAYVDSDQTPFDPHVHARVDEDIFKMEMQHDEGQVPTLLLTIKNPRKGLLAASRRTWAYLSYQPMSGSGPVPIFFGVLVGIPSDLFAELIELKFHARPSDYIERKQMAAEALRVAPGYDPLFLDEAHRDDPDAILEGYSALYHVDRVTHEVTASDILEGEDGTVVFDPSEGLYDSVKMEIGECPLSVIQVQATVHWSQRSMGYVPGPSVNMQSYTGGSFKSDWPKPGASLGGGWYCATSYVVDVLDTDHAHTFSTSSSVRNNDPEAGDCSYDTMSLNATYSIWPGIAVEGTGSRKSQTGLCDPFGYASVNAESPGVNIPSKLDTSGEIALLWILNCSMTLRYAAEREFNEMVIMDIGADLQHTLASPTIGESTEVMKVSGGDVGMPLVIPYAWSDFAGKAVARGEMIFPNDPTAVGGKAYQMCVVAGVAGLIEPAFSDLAGVVTIDGTVQWASLGDQPPQTETLWSEATEVPIGEVMLIEPKTFDLATGSMIPTGASYFFLCLTAGETNSTWTDMEYLPPATSSDDEAQMPVPFSQILGPGDVMIGNFEGGGSGPAIPAVGGSVADGSVTWINLGTTPKQYEIPIGGTMTTVNARTYFATERGQRSIEYLICKARARLRLRSRAVKISWEAPFETCLALSCRKSATLIEPRLPGGEATGKITSYKLYADKDGKFIGTVEIGVPVGRGGSVVEVGGTPEYTADTGYMQRGYQVYDGGTVVVGNDIGYTPPTFEPFDDGLAFPLQQFPGRVTITRPIQDGQVAATLAAMIAPQLSNVPTVQQILQGTSQNGAKGVNLLGNESAVDWLKGARGTFILECDPVAAEILIPPVNAGPFNSAYYVQVTPLLIPSGINLEAE